MHTAWLDGIKQRLFFAQLKFRLLCRLGKHMPATRLEQRAAVFEDRNELSFLPEQAVIATFCAVCDKVFDREPATGFNKAVWGRKIPNSYPLDPNQPTT